MLGCFARYVTVYAQQVRAFNLVHTLARTGYLSAHSEVAILGGGIAGLTAAAASAVQGVRRVAVFEKLANTMRIQRGTDKRFIHPHVYDWPAATLAKDKEQERAGHDLLDWAPGRAGDVIEDLDRQWESLRKQYPALEGPRLNCHGIEILPEGPRWTVRVDGTSAGTFDLVVLAVGFGRDSVDITESYWTDTSLDGLEAESGATWFLSGLGDGGLTDLMRLCIMDFRHRAVLELIDQATREKVGNLLLEAERAGISPEKLAGVFRHAAGIVKPALDSRLLKRKLGRVLLNCPTERDLFSGRSSILNRLIVAYLLIDGRFELFPGGRIDPPQKIGDRRFRITFQEGIEPLVVDHVILRHGPASALEADFPEIWRRCRRLDETWKSARQHEDWTRKPLYSPGDFKPGVAPKLRVDFGEKIGCVVITGSKPLAGLNHRQRVAAALQRFKSRLDSGKDRDIDPDPVHIHFAEAFSSPASYERAVRALCESDIAVFDITGFESAVMLLLGIRASVRRGVTLTVSQGSSPGRFLPFNLAALNPIPLGKGDTEAIAAALETGLASLRAQPDAYLDLPVYDAVRHLGEDHGPLTPEEQILVLRWFDEQYDMLVKDLIGDLVVQAVGEGTKVVTTLDSSSPQLVGQRLYAAVRRAQICIADWTGWRPNVFFEIGVRMAVNPIDPVFILCRERPPGWEDTEKSRWPLAPDPSIEALRAFFSPVEFTFSNYLRIRDEINERRPPMEPNPRGMLSPGRTYRVICESIPRRLEPGGRSLAEMLLGEAARIAGPAVPEEGGFPLLYSDVLADQARSLSVEMLLATWHYLDRRSADGGKGLVDRVRDKELQPNDPQLAALRKVGRQLSARLRNLPPSRRVATLGGEIRRALAVLGTGEEEIHE